MSSLPFIAGVLLMCAALAIMGTSCVFILAERAPRTRHALMAAGAALFATGALWPIVASL